MISSIKLCEKVCKLFGTSGLVAGTKYGWAWVVVCGVIVWAKAGAWTKRKIQRMTRERITDLTKAENLMSILSLDYFANDVNPVKLK